MEPKNFIRNIEDFTCEHCGAEVSGTGYTNHCSQCLWSKHVDNLPGDRANPCCGLMKPIGIEVTGDSYDIVHHCQKCGVTKRNKVADNDDRKVMANILSQS
jgi:hypothetical protein